MKLKKDKSWQDAGNRRQRARKRLNGHTRGTADMYNNLRPVVVLTQSGSIFFGYQADGFDPSPVWVVTLHKARFLVSLSPRNKGWTDLAVSGPLSLSRVTAQIEWAQVHAAAVLKCTEEAESKWEREPWATDSQIGLNYSVQPTGVMGLS